MKVVIQRVQKASVYIENKMYSCIKQGLLLFVGIEKCDNEEDISWLASKICNLRIFSDKKGKMNLNLNAIEGEILVVSQFTLFAKTKKGNRPSFIASAPPDIAIPLYKEFIARLKQITKKEVKTGEFGADMKVNIVNDGPVTIIIDTKNKE